MPGRLDVACGAVLLSVAHVTAVDNGLGRAPPMGWRSWNDYGADVTEERMKSVIEAMVAPRQGGKTLKEVGFIDVGLDDGWEACNTGAYDGFHTIWGKPLVNESKFSDLNNMTAYAHARGLTAGWYVNNCICGETQYKLPEEILRHYEADVASIVGYQFDAVKVDHCGQFNNLTRWAELLNQSGRPVIIENCHWVGIVPRYTESGELWCPFNYFRVSPDIEPRFDSMLTNLQAMPKWADIDKPISQPGCWAYADMLEVGNLPTLEENRAHFAAWSVTSSPLILSFDVTNASLVDWVWPIISNPEVIAVSQQWAGHPGTLIHTKHANMEDMAPDYVWAVECDDSDARQHGWKLRSLQGVDGPVHMIVAKNGQCIDATVDSPIGVRPCNESSPFQVFTFRDSGAISFQKEDGTEQCLEVLGKTGPGVQRTKCFPGDPKHQRFTMKDGVWADFGVVGDPDFPPRCLLVNPDYPFDLPAHFITWQLWAKPQPNGSMAVLVVNRAEKELSANVLFHKLKATFGSMFDVEAGEGVHVRDLFDRKDLGTFEGSFSTELIPMTDSRFYLLTPTGAPLGGSFLGLPHNFWMMLGTPLLCAGLWVTVLCARSQVASGFGLDKGAGKLALVSDRESMSLTGSSSGTDSEGSTWKLVDCIRGKDPDSADLEVEGLTPSQEEATRGAEDAAEEEEEQGMFSSRASKIVGCTASWWAAAIYVTLMFKLTAGAVAPAHPSVNPGVHQEVHEHMHQEHHKRLTLPPFMLTFLVNTVTGLISWVLSQTSSCYSAKLPPARRDEVLKVIALGVMSGGEFGCLNKSLQYLSISERTMLQNSNVLFIMLTAQLCNLEALTPKRVIAGALLAGGGILQGLASSKHKVGANDHQAAVMNAAHVTGILFMVSSMVITSVKWTLIQFMTQRQAPGTYLGEMSKLQLAARVQPISGVMCLLLAVFSELQTVLHPELWHHGLFIRVLAIAFGIAVIMCSELKLVQLTSAVACGVLINLHHIPMVLAGILFFHDHIARESVYGLFFCVIGGCFYATAR